MAKQSKKLIKTLLSLLRDKTSLLKSSTLSLLLLRPRSASSLRLSLLLATPRYPPSSPPSSRALSSFLSLSSSGPRPTASLSISSLMHRLHSTSSAHVALKCLVVVRHVITHGSFILRDQLGYYPVNGGRNFLNLSGFRDKETLEISSWVRFYSRYLETSLVACRSLGVFISSKDGNGNEKGSSSSSSLSNSELMCEVEVLVGLIEETCKVPGSVCDNNCSLVHEILKLVSEDYGHVQRLLINRVGEFKDRVSELTRSELGDVAGLVRRAEGCRERVSEVFGNWKRNETFWEFLRKTRDELARFIIER